MHSRFSQLGLVLFGTYLLLYGGFVALNAFAPEAMEQTPVAGLNIAVLYGFGLILAAVLMSMVYGALCRDEPEQKDAPRSGQGDAR